MKPVFCTDITNDKHSQAIHGEEFIISTTSEEFRAELSAMMEEATAPLKKAQLPRGLAALRFAGLCMFFAFLFSLGEGIKLIPLVVGLAGIALYAGISFYEAKGKQAVPAKERDRMITEALAEANRRVKAELEIPDSAVAADVLCFRYKEKEGKREAVLSAGGAKYVNVEVFCFRNETHLFLADMERVYAFPLHGMKAITPVKESITLTRWNKPMRPDDCGLTQTVRGIPTDVHYILEFTAGNEDYGIYFPCYELKVFQDLTGLS